jgi:hypothetical protein
MNLFMSKPLTVLCCCAILYSQSHSQSGTSSDINITTQLYHSATREQEPIFRGAEYRFFPYQTLKAIIYFGSNTITRGDVTYYGRHYKNIYLLYDQSTDELITSNIAGDALIRLVTPKVESFRIHGSDFIYLPDSVNATTGGFWQVLLSAKGKLLKKEIKLVEEKIVDEKMARVVRAQTKYRMFLRNADYDITDKNAMIQAFSDQKNAISAFLKKNRRRFRKGGFEKMLTETTNYYNEISAPK